jgi:GH24 family phage-related lysozyme (muramidase)
MQALGAPQQKPTEIPVSLFQRQLMDIENDRMAGYNPKDKLWYPHEDDKGLPTIGYGRLVKEGEDFSKGLTNQEVETEFIKNFNDKERVVRRIVPKYDELPTNLQNQLIQTAYRGDIKKDHNWVKLLNEGKYDKAAEEFLDHEEYKERKSTKKDGDSVTRRMEALNAALLNLVSPASGKD